MNVRYNEVLMLFQSARPEMYVICIVVQFHIITWDL